MPDRVVQVFNSSIVEEKAGILCEFEVTLVCKMNFRTARKVTQRNPNLSQAPPPKQTKTKNIQVVNHSATSPPALYTFRIPSFFTTHYSPSPPAFPRYKKQVTTFITPLPLPSPSLTPHCRRREPGVIHTLQPRTLRQPRPAPP